MEGANSQEGPDNGVVQHLGPEAVERHLTMGMALEAVEAAFRELARDEAVQPVRTHMTLPGGDRHLLVMPGYLDGSGALGAKLLSLFPHDQASSRPSHQSVILLFDPETGAPMALLDAAAITAYRTAAASGVATRLLAREDASELALLGAGLQARSHLRAMMAVRPIEGVRVWSRREATVESFLDWCVKEGVSVPVNRCGTPEEAVQGADLVCTVTASPVPILKGEWLGPGSHVNAVGAHTAETRELDSDAVAQARFFVDQREAALAEAGAFLIPRREGRIGGDHIIGEIGELLENRISGRTSAQDRTVFKSLGLAVQDLATAIRVVESAVERDD
jgi:alanine dehydrogenase